MTPAAEWRTAGNARHTHTAFGLQLELDPRMEAPGLPPARGDCSTGAQPPPSRVLLDPEELDRRWRALSAPPARVREVSFEGAQIRTIDFAAPAGYLLWNRDHGRVLISP